MQRSCLLFAFWLLLYAVHSQDNVAWTNMKDEYLFVLDTFFDVAALRPVKTSNNVISVSVGWNLVSILDFDETNGYLEVSGFLMFEWVAESLPASVYDLAVLVQETKVWRPSVILVNSLNGFELIGYDTSVQVRVNLLTRVCQWQPWVVARVACKADVQYYPYDKQECSLLYSMWGDNINETVLQLSTGNSWGTTYFEENGEWEIESTSASTETRQDKSTVSFNIKLSRRPLFYVINIIAPVLLLGLLNVFTFLLPIDSGERVGFSVTCFLSYVVLLNIVMGLLPTSASPLSYLSYYTFIMMVFSAGMSLMTIITIRIHYKPDSDPVPYCLAGFYLLLTCRICRRKSNKVQKINISSTNSSEPLSDDTLSQYSDDESVHRVKDVKWQNIARFMDIFFFLSFLTTQVFYSISYLLPIFLNSE